MPAPIVIGTGHPPPLEQVRDQLRTSTGCTFVHGGVQRIGRKPLPAPAADWSIPADPAAATMLRALRDMAWRDRPLPTLHQLANLADLPGISAVRAALDLLEQAGVIRMAVLGNALDSAAPRMIRIVPTGMVLRSRDCPSWLEAA